MFLRKLPNPRSFLIIEQSLPSQGRDTKLGVVWGAVRGHGSFDAYRLTPHLLRMTVLDDGS